jgi:hypothetical protein
MLWLLNWAGSAVHTSGGCVQVILGCRGRVHDALPVTVCEEVPCLTSLESRLDQPKHAPAA